MKSEDNEYLGFLEGKHIPTETKSDIAHRTAVTTLMNLASGLGVLFALTFMVCAPAIVIWVWKWALSA